MSYLPKIKNYIQIKFETHSFFIWKGYSRWNWKDYNGLSVCWRCYIKI